MTDKSPIQKAAEEKYPDTFFDGTIDRDNPFAKKHREIWMSGANSEAAKEKWQPKWIDVKERLPETKSYVLTTDGVHFSPGIFYGKTAKWLSVDYKVLYWMPISFKLPCAPLEDKEEKQQ